MLVKVGVNRLLRSRHGDHQVTLHRPQVLERNETFDKKKWFESKRQGVEIN